MRVRLAWNMSSENNIKQKKVYTPVIGCEYGVCFPVDGGDRGHGITAKCPFLGRDTSTSYTVNGDGLLECLAECEQNQEENLL